MPLTPLLIFMMQYVGTLVWVQHALCITLLVGRISHAWGISQEVKNYRFRVAGMVLTLGVLGVASVRLLVGSVAWEYFR